MANLEKQAPGTFSWAELGTTDAAGAKEFYAKLFEWTAEDMPMGEQGVYTILKLNGLEVAALYGLQEEQKKRGVPPHWLLYVAVSSADQTVARATELGAKVHAGPFDVFDYGRMAVIQDPQGAMFAIWQAGKHDGAQTKEVTRRHCWSELATTDLGKAQEFYTGLFGWTTNKQQFGPMEYTTWVNQGTPAGGALQMDAQWKGAPPHWMAYFSVASIEESTQKVSALGGSVCVPPTDIPGVGRFSVVNDPQGAVFSMIQPKM